MKEEGNQDTRTYTVRRQETVAQWVALRPIFEVCVQETGYEGGGADMGPVVTVDGSGLPTEGYAKIYLGRYTGAEAMGIRKEWREGKSSGSRQRKSDGRRRGRGIGYGQRSCE